MTQDELKTALRIANSELSVNGERLQSANIARMFRGFLPDGRFDVAEAVQEVRDHDQIPAVLITGKLKQMFLGQEGVRVQAKFFLVNGVAESIIEFPGGPPADWCRSVSAAGSGGVGADAIFHDARFVLDSRQLALGEPFDRTFSSVDGDDREAASNRQPKPEVKKIGLLLEANIQLQKVDELLAEFLGRTASLPVKGRIEFADDDSPRLWLEGQLATPLEFNGQKLELGYEFLSRSTTPTASNKPRNIRERLRAELRRDDVVLPLAVTFEPNSLSDTIIIESQFTEKKALSLAQLAHLLPGEIDKNIGKAIPQNIQNILDKLKLTDFALEVSGEPLSLRSACARVELQKTWPIVEGLVSFGDLALDVIVTNSSGGWDVQPYFSGTVGLAGGKFTGIIDPRGQTFSCTLEANSPLQFDNLFNILATKFGFDKAPFGTGDLKLTGFEIWGNPDGRSYSLDIETSQSWGVDLGTLKIDITNLSLFIELDEGKPTVILGGSFKIGGVAARLEALYSSSDGWTLSAAVYDIPVTELLSLIPAIKDVGAKLPQVNLPLLSLTVTPTKKAFEIQAVGEIKWPAPLGLPQGSDFSGRLDLKLKQENEQGGVNYDITFDGQGALKLNDGTVGATIHIGITNPAKNGKRELAIVAAGKVTTSGPIAKFLPSGSDVAILPNIQLTSGTFKYSEAAGLFLNSDIKITPDAGSVVPALDLAFGLGSIPGSPPGGSRRYAAGVGVKTPIGLSRIAGGESSILAQFLGKIEIRELGLFYASENIASGLGDPFPAQGKLAKGPSVAAEFGVGGLSTGLILLPRPEGAGRAEGQGQPRGIPSGALPAGATGAPAPTKASVPASDGDGLRKWIKVQKTIGPLEISRVGVQWQDKRLSFLLDAGVEIVGLKVALAGLRVGIMPANLAKPALNDFTIGLDGLEIGYTGGPISISGAFLKDRNEYSGSALIRAASFTITAIGSYTTIAGKPSLFIFGAFVGTIGGPPAFVVQGVAAGFGYNRGLTIPPVEKVHEFPLVALVMSEPGKPQPDSREKLSGQNRVSADRRAVLGGRGHQVHVIQADRCVRFAHGSVWHAVRAGVARRRYDAAATKSRGERTAHQPLLVRRAGTERSLCAGRRRARRPRRTDNEVIPLQPELPTDGRLRLLHMVQANRHGTVGGQ